ncbi:DUF3124 domain-containing protein [Geminocystis herdmanii]|uniref:DUF3124 domain-containing protein n=1 Tax=Geminocystis herdmanii TaxID=669359 RepID=UPI00047549B9|nr:DUF3124 domain-containing protein [Geminocystis herdmanii]
MVVKYFFPFFLICLFLLGCETNQTNSPIVEPNSIIPVNTESIELPSDFKAVTGQLIYLPIYSNIYHSNQRRLHNLGITVTFHNTDLENSIIIKSIEYYDTEGNLIENFLTSPVSLKPLASTNFFIPDNDTRGGIGANLLIEWVADKKVFSPIAEAIMLSTASTQGISFTTQGKVVKELRIKN